MRSIALVFALAFAIPAAAVPLQVAHQARLLTDTGAPLDGVHQVKISLYPSQTGGAARWSEVKEVMFEDGYGAFVIGGDDANPLGTDVLNGDPLWVGLALDGWPDLGERLPLASAPYAIRAHTATNVVGGVVDASELRVNGAVVADADGFTAEVTWDQITGVPETLVDGDDDTLRDVGCENGEVLMWQGTGWICGGPASLSTDLLSGTLGVDLLPVGTGSGTVAAGDHTHSFGQVTGQAAYSQLPVGTAANTVAAGDHGHALSSLSGRLNNSQLPTDISATTLRASAEVVVGSTTATCGSALAGAIRYVASSQRLEFCNGSYWIPVNGDAVPAPFSFARGIGAASTQVTSEQITLTDFNVPIPVGVSGPGAPQLRIDSGSWGTSGTLNPGSTLQVRATTSSSLGSTQQVTVDAGGVIFRWDVQAGHNSQWIKTVVNAAGAFNIVIATDSSMACSTACSNRGLTCDATQLGALQAWANQNTNNYRSLIVDQLGLTFAAGSPVATPMNLSQPYFGIGCSSGTFQFNGFGSNISGCNNTNTRYDVMTMNCSNSGYNNGNYSGPRICTCL